jgi:hypothetical protein
MRITKDQMVEIFELRTRGTSWDTLGLIYKVAPSTIRRYYKLAETSGFAVWKKPVKPDESATLLRMFDALTSVCFAQDDVGVIVDTNTDSTFEWGEVREARRKIKQLINFAYSHGIKENML